MNSNRPFWYRSEQKGLCSIWFKDQRVRPYVLSDFKHEDDTYPLAKAREWVVERNDAWSLV